MGQENRIKIPSLHGGISQQPTHLRFDNQVEESVNVDFSVVDGVSKRPGTWFIAKPDPAPDAAGNYRLHAINRDGSEKYLVLYGEGDYRVFTDAGVEAAVTISSAAAAYLALNSPTADQIRIVTVADYSIIVNTTVEVSGTTSIEEITVSGEYKNFEVLSSYNPAYQSFWRATTAGSQPAGLYQYDVDPNTFGIWRAQNITAAGWGAPGNFWDDANKNPMGFKLKERKWYPASVNITGYTYTHAGTTLTKVGAFAGYTHHADDYIRLSGGSPSVTAGYYQVVSKTSDDTIVIGGMTASNRTGIDTGGISREFEVSVNFNTTAAADMYDVALRFQNALQADGATMMLVNWQPPNVVGGIGFFQIVSQYRGADLGFIDLEAPSSGYDIRATTRPFQPDNSQVGTGTPPTSTVPLADRWLSWSEDGVQVGSIDADKMPVRMTRTGVSPPTFSIDQIDWKPRTSGDNDTNPIPSLWQNGLPISDVFFFRNRLWFAGGEHLVASQAGDFFNFFLDDATEIVDSDPIDVSLSSEQVTLIDFVVPFRKTLLIFTKAGRQFELSSPEALTPSTAAITPSTDYQSAPVRPQPVGSSVYFVGNEWGYNQLREYYYDDIRIANVAGNVSAHVPRFLPNTVRSIIANSNHNIVGVLPVDCCEMYVYRFYWIGGRKEQSSWTKYQFNSNYRVCDVAMLGDSAFILVESNSQYVIERLMMGPEDSEEDEHYVCPCPNSGTTTTTTTTTTAGPTTTAAPTTPPPSFTAPPTTTPPPPACCSTEECFTRGSGSITVTGTITYTFQACCSGVLTEIIEVVNINYSASSSFENCNDKSVSSSDIFGSFELPPGCGVSTLDPITWDYGVDAVMRGDGTWTIWVLGMEANGTGCQTASLVATETTPGNLCGNTTSVTIDVDITVTVTNRLPCP